MNAFARWICLVLVVPTIGAAAQLQNPDWTIVLHADESTGNVWLSTGMADQNGDLSYGMRLVRVQGGQPGPFFLDGIAYNTQLDCSPGPYCELLLGWELNALFKRLGWGQNLFEEEEYSRGIFSGEHPTDLGHCAGHWAWANDRPLCLKGRPARPRGLADEWQSFSDRQKLDLLLYMHRKRMGPQPAAPTISWRGSTIFCSSSDSAEERRDCPPWSDVYADPIISVARNMSPLPKVPDSARAHLLSGNTILQTRMRTLKDADDAVGEFSLAVDNAPWWSDAYYNRAIAESVAGFCRRAYIDFERVLKLRPSPEDASDVRNRMQQLPCQE